MPKRRSLEDIKPFVNNDIPIVYNTDGVNPIYVDNDTGEVWQKDRPKGAIVLPEVDVKGSILKAKESMDRLPKEKGLENPTIDPFLGLIGAVGGALYKGAQGSIALGTDLLFPGSLDENLIGAGINNIAGKTIRGTKNLLLGSVPRPLALPIRGTIGLPDLSRKVETNVLPSSGKTINLGNKEYNDNRAFISKFNKWNRRYGYPSLKTDLANDSKALDEAIQDRLLQHNTFLRGVFVDTNHPEYNIIREKLIQEGVENPNKDDILAYLSNHYLIEGGMGGRSGFDDITDVKKYIKLRRQGYTPEEIKEKGFNIANGAIYTSNGLDQAMGYANRKGRLQHRGVFKVRRPISFEGTREDWVNNAEFNFSNNIKSTLYKEYELPYLMKYGISPQESSFDKNTYNTLMRGWVKDKSGAGYFVSPGARIKQKLRANGISESELAKFNFKEGTPFDYYRNIAIDRQLSKAYDKRIKEILKDMPSDTSPFDIAFNPTYNEKKIVEQTIDDVSKYVNSKNFNKYVYKQYKDAEAIAIKDAKKRSIKILTPEELKKKVIKEGITPVKGTSNIGTSERMRTTSINHGNPFQHFIFSGEGREPGLEIVERVPFREWSHLHGSTAHHGTWYPGTSRKSKRDGGSIHIAPSKRGTFTAAATKHRMSVQEFASRVLRNKDSYSPAMVNKANFARNASKWNH